MKFTRIIVGELILIFASVLIFRSVWTLMDQYIGDANLIVFLAIGIVFTLIGMWMLNKEVNCEMEKHRKHTIPN